MQRNMPSYHFDAKVFHLVGDINFNRPADLPDGYPNALGVVHGEPPLSLELFKVLTNPTKPPGPDAESKNVSPLKIAIAFPASETIQIYPVKYIRTRANQMVKFNPAARL